MGSFQTIFQAAKMPTNSEFSTMNKTQLPVARMPVNSNEVEFYEILTPVYIAKPSTALSKPLPLALQVEKDKSTPKMNMKLRSKPVKRNSKTRTLEATFNPIKQIKKVASKVSEKAKQIKKTKMALKKMHQSNNVKTLASSSTRKVSTAKSNSSKQGRLKSANPPKVLRSTRSLTKNRKLSSGSKSQLRGVKPKQINEESKLRSKPVKRFSKTNTLEATFNP